MLIRSLRIAIFSANCRRATVYLDDRQTFYTARGDVFAWATVALTAVLVLVGLGERLWRRS